MRDSARKWGLHQCWRGTENNRSIDQDKKYVLPDLNYRVVSEDEEEGQVVKLEPIVSENTEDQAPNNQNESQTVILTF